jgi:hypothetical protein
LASLPELCTRIGEIHLYEQFETWTGPTVAIITFPRLDPIIRTFLRDNDWDIQQLWPEIPRITWERKIPVSFITSMLARLTKPIPDSHSHQQDHGTAVSTPVQPVELCSNEESLSYFCSILPLIKHLTKVVLVFPLSGSAPLITPQRVKSVLESLVRCNSGCLRSIVIIWGSYEDDNKPPLDFDYVFSSVRVFSLLHLNYV